MSYCPTCGLVGYRWAGCSDDYHNAPACDAPAMLDSAIERVYGGSATKSGTAGVSAPPSRGENLVGGPHTMDVTRYVNPGPASDGA